MRIKKNKWLGCSCDLRRLSRLGIVVVDRDEIVVFPHRLPDRRLTDSENSELSILIELSNRGDAVHNH